MAAADTLRTARASRGWSQRQLADAAGTRQPRIADVESGKHDAAVDTLETWLRALGHQTTLLPTRTRPVWEAAVAVRAALEANDETLAFREVIQLADDLAHESAAIRVALSVTAPPPVGDARFDALIAAVTDYRLTSARAPRPEWIASNNYRLSEPWDVESVPALRADARRRTPASIRRHGVFLADSELASV
jgi:transcriptional regulator with XRE-family HTH domain